MSSASELRKSFELFDPRNGAKNAWNIIMQLLFMPIEICLQCNNVIDSKRSLIVV